MIKENSLTFLKAGKQWAIVEQHPNLFKTRCFVGQNHQANFERLEIPKEEFNLFVDGETFTFSIHPMSVDVGSTSDLEDARIVVEHFSVDFIGTFFTLTVQYNATRRKAATRNILENPYGDPFYHCEYRQYK